MSLNDQLLLANQATKIARTLDAKAKSELILAIASSVEDHSESIIEVNKLEVRTALD